MELNVYTDRKGNVYRRTDKGWEQRKRPAGPRRHDKVSDAIHPARNRERPGPRTRASNGAPAGTVPTWTTNIEHASAVTSAQATIGVSPDPEDPPAAALGEGAAADADGKSKKNIEQGVLKFEVLPPSTQ